MAEHEADGQRREAGAAPAERHGGDALGEAGGRRPMAEREARLAAQLRENLKKRKALARARQGRGSEH